MAPGFSLATVRLLISILDFFCVGESLLLGGGDGRFSDEGKLVGMTVPGADVVEAGFFKPLRDGGGGASSVKPCERNCDLYVLTVFAFSESRRISMDIEAFFEGIVIEVGFTASDSDSSFGFFGIRPSLSIDGVDGLTAMSLSFSACVSFSRSLSFLCDEDESEDEDVLADFSLSLSRCRSFELVDDEDLDDDDDRCLLELLLLLLPSLRSLSLLELERSLSLRCLSLELRCEDDDDEDLDLLEELFDL